MNHNDKKILTSAYFDKALTAEESQWMESELSQDQEMQRHWDDLNHLHTLTQKHYSAPTMPHTLEYNWQRCRARMREQEAGSIWNFLRMPLWVRQLGSLSFALLAVVSFIFNLRTGYLSKTHIASDNSHETTSQIRSVVLPVSYAANNNTSVERAWSPRPEVSVSTFSAGRGNVIWLSGMKYRSETNIIK
ncbi:MAG: hypothetical protein K1X66_04795 [Verrucomicrobiae bacterium]|nr:hypothetical protein [Verrucomicrobiae bacterium]